MRRELHCIWIAVGLIVLALLTWLTLTTRPDAGDLLPTVLFGELIVLTTTFGVLLAGGTVSLLPMTTVAAYLVVGPVLAGWAAFAGALAYGLIRARWAEQLGVPRVSDRFALLAMTALNAAMHATSILAGGAVFRFSGGLIPLLVVDTSLLVPLALLCLTYLCVNYMVAAFYFVARGRAPLQLYLRTLPNLTFYEGAPLIFAPLVALIYTRLGLGQFILFAFILVISSLVMRNLADTSRRLERRVQELDSLQAVGQALSASLQVETVLAAIYDQVAGLMPARNFYVALHNPDVNEVSFPLAVENDARVQWHSRRTGNGLTEHVLRTRHPLLIPQNIAAKLDQLGLDHIGRPAACWLGVPMVAGDQCLGVIAVQSYNTPLAYDSSHQEVLSTIAAQAAVAIQNANLYAQTDEALARRVQELNSILRTTREGMLLLDLSWRVLAANRALADLVGSAQLDLTGQTLNTPRPDREKPLVELLGYKLADLEADCQDLSRGEWTRKRAVVALGPPERHVERTLAPVRDREGAITAWLLVLRDMTEEVELARLREDMTHMLVHDLRSPLTVLKSSLEMMKLIGASGDAESLDKFLAMAQRGSERMLSMVNELLDVSKLEAGQLVLHPEAVEVESLLKDTAARLALLASAAQITLEIAAEPDLPPLHVDPQLVARVLNNLVDNAIKFTPDGGHIRLWARLDAASTPGAMLVGVSDTGPGIPAEERDKLFAKFQVTSTSGRRAGTGLGLAFCKLAVEAHAGEIWAESEPGQGSTFVMTLPVS